MGFRGDPPLGVEAGMVLPLVAVLVRAPPLPLPPAWAALSEAALEAALATAAALSEAAAAAAAAAATALALALLP